MIYFLYWLIILAIMEPVYNVYMSSTSSWHFLDDFLDISVRTSSGAACPTSRAAACHLDSPSVDPHVHFRALSVIYGGRMSISRAAAGCIEGSGMWLSRLIAGWTAREGQDQLITSCRSVWSGWWRRQAGPFGPMSTHPYGRRERLEGLLASSVKSPSTGHPRG